jgi:molybdopterin/thiamine biosynthesis adenylyltransferase
VHGRSPFFHLLLSRVCCSPTDIGAFTVFDGAKTSEADLGNNWFVDDSYLGKSRAATVKELLLEMNPDVKGHHIEADPVQLIHSNINSFAAYVAAAEDEGAFEESHLPASN